MITIPITPKPSLTEIPDNKPLQINSLPFDGPILMQIGLDETAEEEVDIRNLRSFLGKDDEEDDEEEQDRIWIRAKSSISQELAHKLEAERPKTKVELPNSL